MNIVEFQYQETLIWLVEKNRDHQWTSDFRNLRKGGNLAWGGAGSVNDWGPYFDGFFEHVWYGDLYDIIFDVFRSSNVAEDVLKHRHIKRKDRVEVIRCSACGQKYQHPNSFEAHVAAQYYAKYLVGLIEGNKLMLLVKPEYSFNSDDAKDFRNWLSQEYEKENIKIYDFVTGKYRCIGCGIENSRKTEHDLYLIKDALDERNFSLLKTNDSWLNYPN